MSNEPSFYGIGNVIARIGYIWEDGGIEEELIIAGSHRIFAHDMGRKKSYRLFSLSASPNFFRYFNSPRLFVPTGPQRIYVSTRETKNRERTAHARWIVGYLMSLLFIIVSSVICQHPVTLIRISVRLARRACLRGSDIQISRHECLRWKRGYENKHLCSPLSITWGHEGFRLRSFQGFRR